MKHALTGGYIIAGIWAFTLQSCEKKSFTPANTPKNDSTYNGPTCGTDSTFNDNPSDSTYWDDDNWGNGGGTDSTDWNGGGNPADSLPG